MKVFCHQCRKEFERQNNYLARSRKLGAPVYCSQTCAGLARRTYKPVEQKKAEKRLYDMEYRKKNNASLKKKRAAYFQRTYDPAEAATYRKKRMHLHIAYCQRPEYVIWKKEYDKKYRARKNFGEYWECFLLTQDIEGEVLSRSSHYEIRIETGTLNKSTKRKRDYERIISSKPETGSLGNLERHQRR